MVHAGDEGQAVGGKVTQGPVTRKIPIDPHIGGKPLGVKGLAFKWQLQQVPHRAFSPITTEQVGGLDHFMAAIGPP